MTKVWLCHSSMGGYEIFPLRNRPKRYGGYCIQYDSEAHYTAIAVCAKHLLRKFPHLKMEVDSEPRRVEMTMEFCD